MGRPAVNVIKPFTSGSRANTKEILFVTIKGILMSMTEHMHKHIYGKRIITAEQARQYWEELNSMRDICASDPRIWQVYAKLTSQMIMLIQEPNEEEQETEVIAIEVVPGNKITKTQTLKSNNVTLNTTNTYNLRNKGKKKNNTLNKQTTPDFAKSKNKNIAESRKNIKTNNCPCLVEKSPKQSRQTRRLISINKSSQINKINYRNKKPKRDKNLTNADCLITKQTNISFRHNELPQIIQSVDVNESNLKFTRLNVDDNLVLDLSIRKTGHNQTKESGSFPNRNETEECVVIDQNFNPLTQFNVNQVKNDHQTISDSAHANVDIGYRDGSNSLKESSTRNSFNAIIETPLPLKVNKRKGNCKTKRTVCKRKAFSKKPIKNSQYDQNRSEFCDISEITLKNQDEFSGSAKKPQLVGNKNDYLLMSVSNGNKTKKKSRLGKNVKGTVGKNEIKGNFNKKTFDSHSQGETRYSKKPKNIEENVGFFVDDNNLTESNNIIDLTDNFSRPMFYENSSVISFIEERHQLSDLSKIVQMKTKPKCSDSTLSPENLITNISIVGKEVSKDTVVSIFPQIFEGQVCLAAYHNETGSQFPKTLDNDCLDQIMQEVDKNEFLNSNADDANVIHDMLSLRSNQTTPDIIDPIFNAQNYLERNIQEPYAITELQNDHVENNNVYNNIVTQFSEIFLESQDQITEAENIGAHSNALIIDPHNQLPIESDQVLDICTDTLIDNIEESINTGNIDTAQMSISTEKLYEMQMEKDKVGQEIGDFQVAEIKALDLSWLRRIRYVRIVESGEYFNECCLPECFWDGNNDLPREWMSDFENWE